MKTVGERIRQARTARRWSGLDLALRCGYKSQSGIANLENRTGGAGGKRISKIADILRVPVSWLLNGPDSDAVPFLPDAYTDGQLARITPAPTPSIATETFSADPWTTEVLQIMAMLKPHEKQGALAHLRTYVHHLGLPQRHSLSTSHEDGHPVSMAYPKEKAA